MLSIATTALRGFLLLSGAVVLGLSVTLAKHQRTGGVPPETGFAAFAGAFGIISSAVGLVALFMESFPQLVALAADGLAALFYLAGGIAMAIAFKGVSCGDESEAGQMAKYVNKLLNGGCGAIINGLPICGIFQDVPINDDNALGYELKQRCTRVQADYAFEFIACVFGVGAIILTLFASKRAGKAIY